MYINGKGHYDNWEIVVNPIDGEVEIIVNDEGRQGLVSLQPLDALVLANAIIDVLRQPKPLMTEASLKAEHKIHGVK